MAEDNAIDQGCSCPDGEEIQTHQWTWMYLYWEAACWRPLILWCDWQTVNAPTWEDFASKMECYMDSCCSFFELTDVQDPTTCGAGKIFYIHHDTTSDTYSLKCSDICTLLNEAVANNPDCDCDGCWCDEDCDCNCDCTSDSECKNPWWDRLVGASPNDDNPRTLIDILQSNSCIEWALVNPGTDNETIEAICDFTYNLIDTEDWPWSWPTCPEGNGNIVQNWQTWWKVVCPECVPIGTTWLLDSISEFPLLWSTDWFIWVWGDWGNDMTSCSNVANNSYTNWANENTTNNWWIFKAPISWRYDLDFSVPMRWTHGIRTIRMQLQVLTWANATIIVEDTIEWPDFATWDFENAFSWNSAATNNSDAVHGALIRWLSRFTFKWSRKRYLEAWDCIGLVLKYSANDIDEEPFKDDLNISIHGINDNWVTNGQWPGAFISWQYIPSLRHPVL